MRLEPGTLYFCCRPPDGPGTVRARPPERSGDRGAPRATAKWVGRRAGYAGLLLVALAVLLIGQRGGAQSLTYSSGQNASPAYEGWEENPDGSFNFLFGYMNRNWEEELDVPVGPDNTFDPGGPDRGQPTHFLPRRNRFVFKVRVPKDWGEKELIWTLTTKGKTEKAY